MIFIKKQEGFFQIDDSNISESGVKFCFLLDSSFLIFFLFEAKVTAAVKGHLKTNKCAFYNYAKKVDHFITKYRIWLHMCNGSAFWDLDT